MRRISLNAVLLLMFPVMFSCEEAGASYLVNTLNVEIEATYYFDFTATGGTAGSYIMHVPPGVKMEITVCNYPGEIKRLVLRTNAIVFYDKTTASLTNDFVTDYDDGGGCGPGLDTSEFVISANM